MTDGDGGRERLSRRFEAMLERVRGLERGGDLEGLILEEVEEIGQLLHEAAVTERSRLDASKEADFSPSALSEVRQTDGEPSPQGPVGSDAGGSH